MKIKQDYMYQYNYLIVITSTDKDTFSLNTFLEDYVSFLMRQWPPSFQYRKEMILTHFI